MRIRYSIYVLVILHLLSLISLISCENDKLCDEPELPILLDTEPNDKVTLELDIDRDCSNDILFTSSESHALGNASSRKNTFVISLHESVRFAVIEMEDSIFRSEYVHIIEDTSMWIEGIYDRVYITETGTQVSAGHETTLISNNRNFYPKAFDDINSIPDHTVWLADTLVIFSDYSSYSFYPVDGDYHAWESNYNYGLWDTGDRKYLGILLENGAENKYFGVEISVENSFWLSTIHQIKLID